MTNETNAAQTYTQIESIYRTESRRIFATLIRLLRDFDLAEDALHEAFRAAMEQWPTQGIPANPRAWLVSAGRFKAIDSLRRRTLFDNSLVLLSEQLELEASLVEADSEEEIRDDQLQLIFICCHPILSVNARVALTLREVCGLTTEAIAHAFLTSPATLAQRIVRAKTQIRDAHVPYEVPSRDELAERVSAVLQVIYLVFNEGYSASSGESLIRSDLSQEAIRLGHLLAELLPEPEVIGLLALMLLQDSRRLARISPEGDLVLLEMQDRSLWDQPQIEAGTVLARQAWRSGQIGPYTLQAAIAAVYTAAPTFTATDWAQIVALYDLLLQIAPSPVIEINRAVAVAMRDGPGAGLALVDVILARGDLVNYHYAYAARGELCHQLGKLAEARTAYQQAIALAEQEPERRHLEKKLAALPV